MQQMADSDLHLLVLIKMKGHRRDPFIQLKMECFVLQKHLVKVTVLVTSSMFALLSVMRFGVSPAWQRCVWPPGHVLSHKGDILAMSAKTQALAMGSSAFYCCC